MTTGWGIQVILQSWGTSRGRSQTAAVERGNLIGVRGGSRGGGQGGASAWSESSSSSKAGVGSQRESVRGRRQVHDGVLLRGQEAGRAQEAEVRNDKVNGPTRGDEGAHRQGQRVRGVRVGTSGGPRAGLSPLRCLS